MPGVEGLVHISELAQHHVENPREVVSQSDLVRARIIEVDAERRRLSLSLKRVEGGGVQQRADDSEVVEGTPNLDLSEEVFPDQPQPVAEAEPIGEAEGESGEGEPEAAPEEAAAEAPVEELAAEAPEPEASAEVEAPAETEPPAEPEPPAEAEEATEPEQAEEPEQAAQPEQAEEPE
jgi:small subunit ribosomal protein S1